MFARNQDICDLNGAEDATDKVNYCRQLKIEIESIDWTKIFREMDHRLTRARSLVSISKIISRMFWKVIMRCEAMYADIYSRQLPYLWLSSSTKNRFLIHGRHLCFALVAAPVQTIALAPPPLGPSFAFTGGQQTEVSLLSEPCGCSTVNILNGYSTQYCACCRWKREGGVGFQVYSLCADVQV